MVIHVIICNIFGTIYFRGTIIRLNFDKTGQSSVQTRFHMILGIHVHLTYIALTS